MSSTPSNWYDFPAIDWDSLFHPHFSYRYFRQPLSIPEPAGITCAADVCTPLIAAWIADAALLAYGGIGEKHMDLLEFDALLDGAQLRGHRLGNWAPDAKSVKAIFAYNSSFAVLAFRGTKSVNWMNSAVDLAAFSVREEPLAADAGRIPSETSTEDAAIRVHAGFQFAFNTEWDDIRCCLESYRAKHPLSPIFFTGHSMGAAFATMAMARFRGGKAALHTFGSPRVGNKAFCEEVRKNADLGVFRFVNNRDLMTHVPPCEKSFEHTCGLMQIDPEGIVTPCCGPADSPPAGIEQVLRDAAVAVKDYIEKLPPPPELMDHAQRRYCYYLWRWARNGQVP